MFGGHFYHEKTRKAVALFGKLFNNLYVVRKNSSGAVISQVKVPLAYAPKSKYLERIRENPDLTNDTKVAIKLPRMSFEITSFGSCFIFEILSNIDPWLEIDWNPNQILGGIVIRQ